MSNTVTLEQAEKIKELGIEIDTEFIRVRCNEHYDLVHKNTILSYQPMAILASPQAEEMLDRMPDVLENDGLYYHLYVIPSPNWHHVKYADISENDLFYLTQSESLSIAVGDMFIWCLEQGYIK